MTTQSANSAVAGLGTAQAILNDDEEPSVAPKLLFLRLRHEAVRDAARKRKLASQVVTPNDITSGVDRVIVVGKGPLRRRGTLCTAEQRQFTAGNVDAFHDVNVHQLSLRKIAKRWRTPLNRDSARWFVGSLDVIGAIGNKSEIYLVDT